MSRLTNAGLLKFLRDNGPCSLTEAANNFRTNVWPSRDTVRPGDPPPLIYVVNDLIEVGLVRMGSGDKHAEAPFEILHEDDMDPDVVEIGIANPEVWQRIQSALSISLTELNAKQSGTAMTVSPVFGAYQQVPSQRDYPEVLVLMPFTEEMDRIYDEIRSVVLGCGVTVGRADDFFGSGFIMHDIWWAICDATLIIADCTARNPNVFYEVGLAHAVGVPALLLTQDVNDIPFDIRHHRVIPYDPSQIREFRITLEANVRAELSPRIDLGGPSSIGPSAARPRMPREGRGHWRRPTRA